MNRLKHDKQEAVIAALVEGNSIRSVERMTGVHRDTIMRLMGRVGEACGALMEDEMRDLQCSRIQVDEIWCFVGKKERHITEADDPSSVGHFWTFVALDADTKLVPTFRVGKRDIETATRFMTDLSSRLANRVQLSSDHLRAYIGATERAFGGDVDYGQIVKSYEADPLGPGRYSPPHVVGVKRTRIVGDPDPKHLSTSLIEERQNLTMRMSMRRFTRLTNGFSKKVENLRAAVALHFAHYNFVRMHGSLPATPAMAAGVATRKWSVGDLVALTNW